MAQMDDDQFQSVLQAEIQGAVNYYDSELSAARSDVMRYYLAEPFGNEQEGRSQVVQSEVADVIEYVMPSLMKVFASSNKFVRFDAKKPQDVDAAKAATDLVNFVVYNDNEGFAIIHNWMKDALLFKQGAVKCHYKEEDRVSTDVYTGLTEEELTFILEDDALEVVSQDQMESEMGLVYDVEVRRTEKVGKVHVDNIPPEELIFNRRATSLEDCSFIAHRALVRRGDLIAQGYDEDIIMSAPTDGDLVDDAERSQRFEEIESGMLKDTLDASMEEITVVEAYIRADYDGDGIPELRRVVALNDGTEVLENEPFDRVPFALLSPILMPHRMVGRSVAELVMDLQLIKSTVMRQMLDNLYLSNNSRVMAVEGQVNLEDLLSSRPGGIVRTRAPGMVQPLQVPQIGSTGFQMLEYVDSIRDQRTGFSAMSGALNPDTLQSTTASAVNATIMGAQQKVEMIARVFAETGCKQLARIILHLLKKHQKDERVIRVAGGFQTVDPSQWSEDFDVAIEVGLGNGREDEKMAMLTQIAGKQEQLLAQLGPSNPVVRPSQYINTLKKMAEMAGFADTDQFFTSGEQLDQALAQQAQQEQQPQEDPEIALKREKMMAEIELEREKLKAELELRRFEMEAELELRRQKLALGGSVSDNLPRA